VEISRGYSCTSSSSSNWGNNKNTWKKLKILSTKDNTLPFLQKAVLLQTAHLTRKFLNLD
jgi:hypothetical protein